MLLESCCTSGVTLWKSSFLIAGVYNRLDWLVKWQIDWEIFLMSYHELNLEFMKASKSCLQHHSAFLHPHSALFDESWKKWFLIGKMRTIVKNKGSYAYYTQRDFQRAIMEQIVTPGRHSNSALNKGHYFFVDIACFTRKLCFCSLQNFSEFHSSFDFYIGKCWIDLCKWSRWM